MANYAISDDLRSGQSSGDVTQNVNTVDTLTLTLDVNFGAQISQMSNCWIYSQVGGGSFNSVVTIVVKFIKAGDYRLVVKNAINNTSLFITGTASGATQTAAAGYGLQIFNSAGEIRMAVDKRQPRIHNFVSGNGGSSSGSFYVPVSGYATPSIGEWTAVQILPNSNFYVDGGGTSGVLLTRADVRSSNASYQIFLGTDDYSIMVLRS